MSGGSSEREDAQSEAPAADGRREGDAAASGVVERETTPAPPDLSRANEEWSLFPSGRPTSVPEYDVAAHAFESSLRHQALPNLPLDVAIPIRTRKVAPADLELRASFLLLHVDGRSSVRDIAELTGITVEDVLPGFLKLTSLGLVELAGTQSTPTPPTSGERPKT